MFCWIGIYKLGFCFFLLISETIYLTVKSDDVSDSEENDSESIKDDAETAWKEKRLIRWILLDYDKRSRPVFDNVSTIKKTKFNEEIQQLTVEFGLSLIQILDLNENEQVLTTSVRSLYRWQDLHLEWDLKSFDNIPYVYIPSNMIWIPDISLYNYADERLEERRPCSAKVFNDGTVEWQPMAIYKSTCVVKMKYFPFDVQTCTLKFGPWTYDGFRVNITFYDKISSLDLSDLVQSPEWRVLNSWANHTEARYPCCEEPYPDISFHIKIKRTPIFYTYILILPCFLLSSLTLIVFWLPPESPAKMVLGMNIFVAFFLMLLLLKDFTPSASKGLPLIGTYYCVNMGIITLSTFLSCVIVNFHFRGDNRQEVPFWLKKLALNFGGKILRINFGPSLIKRQSITHARSIKIGFKRGGKTAKSKNKYLTNKHSPNPQVQVTFQCNDGEEKKEKLVKSPVKNWRKYNIPELTSDKTNLGSPNFLQINNNNNIPGLTIFSDDQANTELFKKLDSYSPLHSPLLKEKLRFMDEAKQVEENGLPNNRDSVYSSLPLLQEALELSRRQIDDFRASLTPSYESEFTLSLSPSFQKPDNSKKHPISESQQFFQSEQIKKVCLDIRAVVKSLRYLHKIQENKESVARILSEWRTVGLVLDRIFFYSYLIIIIFSIILFFPKANSDD